GVCWVRRACRPGANRPQNAPGRHFGGSARTLDAAPAHSTRRPHTRRGARTLDAAPAHSTLRPPARRGARTLDAAPARSTRRPHAEAGPTSRATALTSPSGEWLHTS